jgi:hypothetical protein
MYKTSTYFKKGQIPDTSVTEILQLYKQELEDQSVGNIRIDGSTLTFSNGTFKFVANRYANKFSSFTSGQINIEDNGSEYLVRFEADNSRTFTVAAVIAGAVTLISLITSNFDLSSLIIGLITFALISGIGYGVSTVSFPVYFTKMRNDIERMVQSGQTNYC